MPNASKGLCRKAESLQRGREHQRAFVPEVSQKKTLRIQDAEGQWYGKDDSYQPS